MRVCRISYLIFGHFFWKSYFAFWFVFPVYSFYGIFANSFLTNIYRQKIVTPDNNFYCARKLEIMKNGATKMAAIHHGQSLVRQTVRGQTLQAEEGVQPTNQVPSSTQKQTSLRPIAENTLFTCDTPRYTVKTLLFL